jgi:hypothetical protein
VYSTFLGGTIREGGTGIAVDAAQNAYVVGGTGSPDFPVTKGAFQTALGGNPGNTSNAFVTKLNASGTALVYSTFLGGSNSTGAEPASAFDLGLGIAVDSAGNASVTGGTQASNFPTTAGAVQTTLNGTVNAFVSRLNATGTTLLGSTYFGGENEDRGQAIAVDSSGNIFFTGFATSFTFPTTTGAFQTTFPGQAGFAAKFQLAPLITSLTANPSVLFPPNNNMAPVVISVNATGGTGTVICQITSIISNEPPDPGGDFIITGPLTLDLRATRLGSGNGRIYTVNVQCSDTVGDNATGSVTVTVPHDMGH